MFIIVSPDGSVVYQMYTNLIKKEVTFLHELIAFASIDIIENQESVSTNMFFKSADKFNEYNVTAFVTAGKMKFIMLHEGKNEDSIKNFFCDIYEFYCKALLNPFIDKNSKIFSQTFDAKIKLSMKKNLSYLILSNKLLLA